MRRRSALLAIAAVLLHTLAPLVANAAQGTGSVNHLELCTAQGVVTVEVESGGAPAGALAAAEHCSFCAFHASAAVESPAAQFPRAAAGTAVAAADQPPLRYSPTDNAHPRAPPHHS